MPPPSQLILVQTEVGPGQVSGPGGQTVFGGVSSSAGGSGTLSVGTWADLLAFDATLFDTGTFAYVQTLRRTFQLDKLSALTPDPYVIGNATGGGQWLSERSDPFWVYQPSYWIDDAADAENDGLSAVTPIPIAEWYRRVSQVWPVEGTTMTVTLLSDCGAGEFAFDAGYFGATNNTTLNFVGGIKSKILNNVAITAVTVADPAGVGGTDGTITTASSFATSVGKMGRINAGPRIGATFTILKDLGANRARIGNVGPSYDFPNPSVTLQIGDTFDTFDQFTILGVYRQTGEMNLSAVTFKDITFGGDVAIGGATNFFPSSCVFNAELDIYSASFASMVNCLMKGDIFLYQAAVAYLNGGGIIGHTIWNDNASYIGPSRYTCQASPMRFGGVDGGASIYAMSPWVASFDLAVPAVIVLPGCLFLGQPGTTHWGTGIDTPDKISVKSGGQYIYGVLPNLIGTGVENVLLESNSIPYASLPARDVVNGGGIFSHSDGPLLALGGGSVRENLVVLASGSQSVSLTRGSSFESSLTGDSAFTFIDLPSADTVPHCQNWTFSYLPATHHATFPGVSWPTVPAALNAAALVTAEGTATQITIDFFCDAAGRRTVKNWTAY